MDWKFLGATKDTNHRFLNEYTLHYEVKKENGETAPYTYFVATRNEAGSLRVDTKDYSRPDGVVMALYYVNPETGEKSIMLTQQFRPGVGAYITSFPAGLLDKEDADMIIAAKREAKEEAGVHITDIEVLAPSNPTSEGLSDEFNGFLLARIDRFEERDLEEFEDISCSLVPLSEIPNILKDTKKYLLPLPARLCLLYLLERFQ